MAKSFPFDNKIVNQFRVLNLDEFSRSGWIHLIEEFPNIADDEVKALEELNRFRDLITKKNYLFGEDELTKEKLSVLERWNLFYRQYRNEFPQITKLATSILSLPISTAAVEREIKKMSNQ